MASLEQLLAGRPPATGTSAADVRRAREAAVPTCWVVLDDDPTGTQSVAGLPVLNAWEVDDLAWALSTGAAAVFVMTNTRSLDPGLAAARNREVVTAAVEASRRTGVPVEFISRSDSTLRGHFPLEPDTIIATLAEHAPDQASAIAAVVVCPAFGDSGRVTIDAVHYASGPEGYLPVGRSEFARDATFGYESSDLREWIEEKTGGRTPAADVLHLPLEVIRSGGEATAAALAAASGGRYVVADIVDEHDLRTLAVALHLRRAAGARFVYRVGPPFTRALVGQEVPVPLEAPDVAAVVARSATPGASTGLVVIGSHVGLTTRQWGRLQSRRDLPEVELDVPTLLGDGRAHHLDAAVEHAADLLRERTVILRTSRALVRGADAEDSLGIARSVSDALVEVVNRLVHRGPLRFVVAKGGITSSDVASRGLEMRRAMIVGPMLPGIVSLWDPLDGPAQHVPFIVFAGNVGADESLADVVDKLEPPDPDPRP